MFVGKLLKLLKLVGVGLLSGAAAQAGAELARSLYKGVSEKLVCGTDKQSKNKRKATVKRD